MAEEMTDEALFEGFESCTFPPKQFHHLEHIRVAWLYLRRFPFPVALERFEASLKKYAAAAGATGLYHTTITWAYMLLINERRERHPAIAQWGSFHEANPDLFTWKPSILHRYYRPETLASELARRVFVMPDRFRDEELDGL